MKKINCRICCDKTAELVMTFKNSPLEMWPTSKNLKDKKKDLKVYVCKLCGLTQLQRFSNSQVRSFYKSGSCVLCDSINIEDRFKDINSVYQKGFFKNTKIIDIGGGRNNILGFFKSHEKWICDFDIESKKKLKGIKLIEDDFMKVDFSNSYFDVIFTLNILEHVENPLEFMKKIHKISTEESRVMVEVPNNIYFKKNYSFYAFFFQHILLLTEKSLKNIMLKAGFVHDGKVYRSENQILFMAFKKIKGKKKELKIDKDYYFVDKILKNLNKQIARVKKIISLNQNKDIGFYGAGGSTCVFINHLGKHKNYINSFFDIDTRKHGKYVPGVNKRVRKPQELKHKKPDIVLFMNKKLEKEISKKYNLKNTFVV